ncbi:MAG: hypothetical protein ACK4HE_05715 [Chitinophagaceae bacterium]
MQKFLVALICINSLSACTKELATATTQNPAPDFDLKLTLVNNQGVITNLFERSLNMVGNTVLYSGVQEKTSCVLLKLGGTQVNTVAPRLYVDVTFLNKTKASDIVGMYQFPAANNQITFVTTSVNFPQGNATVIRGLPKSGTLVVAYDASTKTYNGYIDNVTYNALPSEGLSNIAVQGTFRHLAVTK